LLVRERRLRLTREGAIEPVEELRLAGAPRTATSTAVTTDSVARVVNRSGGELVLETDRIRALACAYPGRVLVRRGRRYRVLMPEEQTQLGEGLVWAEPERRRIETHRIRRVELTLEGRGHELRFGGEAAAHLHHPTVLLTESVLGVRAAQQARQLADTMLYDAPIVASYPTGAAVLQLPPCPDAALEALEVLVRLALPAFLRHSEDDVDVVCLREPVHALCIVDRHPGGAGYARATSASVLRHVLYWSQQMVAACGRSPACASNDGCPHCVGGGPRLSPSDRASPSRKAVAELLGSLLGA
jgi:hypothetical protein